MKKFIAGLITIFYMLSTNVCYAFSELYYLKGTTKEAVQEKIETVYLNNKYDYKFEA